MSNLLRKNLSKLKKLVRTGNGDCIRKADASLIKAISEIALNVSNIPTDQSVQLKIKRNQRILKLLGQKRTSITSKRRLVLRNFGFIKLIIKAALAFFSYLF